MINFRSDLPVTSIAPVYDYSILENNIGDKVNMYEILAHMEDRYKAAKLPVCVIGFQPQVAKSVAVFTGDNSLNINLIDKEFDKILIKHFKEYKTR